MDTSSLAQSSFNVKFIIFGTHMVLKSQVTHKSVSKATFNAHGGHQEIFYGKWAAQKW